MNNKIDIQRLDDHTYYIGSFEVKDVFTLVFHHLGTGSLLYNHSNINIKYVVFVKTDHNDKTPKFIIKKRKLGSDEFISREIAIYTAEYFDIMDPFSNKIKKELYKFLSTNYIHTITVWNMICILWNKLNPDYKVEACLNKEMPFYNISIYSYYTNKEDDNGEFKSIPTTYITDDNTIVTNYDTKAEEDNNEWKF